MNDLLSNRFQRTRKVGGRRGLGVGILAAVSSLIPITVGCNAVTPPPGGINDELPVTRLSASNSVPTLSESVVLQCSLVSGSSDGLEFSFSPVSALTSVDTANGTALFIVNEPDLGAAATFRCGARNDLGDGPTSNSVTIIPSG